MINRFIRAAGKAAGRAGVDSAAMGDAVNRLMGRGSLVKTAVNPANPARTRNFATDAATGRHRSISRATADRYASYGRARAIGNAKRGAVGAATAGVAAAGLMGGNQNPEAGAEERNPAEDAGMRNPRGNRDQQRRRAARRRAEREDSRRGPRNGRGNSGRNDRARRRKAAEAKKKGSTAVSFDKAFAAARAAYKSGATDQTKFTWNGKSYSIVTADDVKRAGAKDLREFLNRGGRPSR